MTPDMKELPPNPDTDNVDEIDDLVLAAELARGKDAREKARQISQAHTQGADATAGAGASASAGPSTSPEQVGGKRRRVVLTDDSAEDSSEDDDAAGAKDTQLFTLDDFGAENAREFFVCEALGQDEFSFRFKIANVWTPWLYLLEAVCVFKESGEMTQAFWKPSSSAWSVSKNDK